MRPLESIIVSGGYTFDDPLVMSDTEELYISSLNVVSVSLPSRIVKEFYSESYLYYRTAKYQKSHDEMCRALDIMKTNNNTTKKDLN